MQSPTFCALAWENLVLTASNGAKPCCRFDGEWRVEGPMAEAPQFKALREQMLRGEQAPGCRKCGLEESAGKVSKRLKSNRLRAKRQDPVPTTTDAAVRSLEINLSNLCNLRCVMCSPSRSSNWNRDAEVAGYAQVGVLKPDLERLRPWLKNVELIELLGGETFLEPGLEDLLGLIAREGDPARTTLTLSTNLTIFPSEKIRAAIAQFREVQISLSIDATGARNDYIRHPSKWTEVGGVYEQFRAWAKGQTNIMLNVDATVSAYSFGGLADLLRYLPADEKLLLNPVTTPEFQSVHVLAREVRAQIVREIETDFPVRHARVDELLRYALFRDAPELRAQLIAWTERLDAKRGLSARATTPEIYL